MKVKKCSQHMQEQLNANYINELKYRLQQYRNEQKYKDYYNKKKINKLTNSCDLLLIWYI